MQTNTSRALSSSSRLRSATRVAIGCALVATTIGALLPGVAQALPSSRTATVAAAGAAHQEVETLTMDKVTRMYQAIFNVAVASKDHPELEDALSVDGDVSEAQAAAKIAASPIVVDALKRAGLTSSQYVRLSLTMAATAMGAAALKENPSAKLPDGVTLANVHFLQQHAADMEALQKRFAAKMAAAGVAQ